MRRLIIVLVLLTFALGSLWANANKISTADHPRYAADIVKIQLSKEAINRTTLPQGLYAETNAFGINELDQLFSVNGGTRIIRAHRRLKDVAWEQRTGFDRWFLVKLDGKVKVEDAIRAFAQNRFVEKAIPEYYAYTTAVPNDTYYANNWGHNNTAQLPVYSGSSHSGAGVGTIGYDADMQLAWDQSQGYGSASTIIAIIDTGVDTNHPDLRLVAGYDYGVGDSNPMDDSADPGHGTSCSGVAAGRANNALGLTGVAGGCSVMPLKIAAADGTLGFTAIENALTHAGDNNVDVASMSFGAEGGTAEGDSPSTDTALEYAYAHGVTLLAATANSNTSTIAYPSNHNKVISVGASSPTGQRKSTTSSDGETWWGSNYGTATQDAQTAVDIMAPTILPSTDLMGTAGYNTSASPSGDYYMWFNGTSCATPYAAGVAALLISKDPTLTPDQVRQALVSTCTDMTVDGGAGWDRYTGYGMVNANAALLSLVPGMPSCTITAPTAGSAFNLNSTITVTATATDSDGTISNVKFYIDDVLQNTDSASPYTWNWNTTGFSAGYHTIKAVATDNSSNTATSTVSVTLVPPADEGFETGNFSAYPWVNSSSIPWTVQSTNKYSGTYAAQAGAIGDNASTTLSITLNVTTAGNLSFYYKVSSESNYDFLKFYVDSVQQGSWSGTVDWTQFTYAASVGSHTFAWTYSKDVNTASGSDTAWLDHLNFPANNNFYPPTNLVGNASSGSVSLSWTAPTGNTPSSYKIFRNSVLLTSTAATSYTDNTVTNGASYTYYVTAVYSSPAGESAPSNSVTVVPSTTSTVTIGTGSTTGQHLPVEPYYGYTYSQSIILQSEINQSNHYITKLAWYYNGYETFTDAIVIYMGHTSNTAFASTSSWIPLTSLTQVYSGNLAVPNTAGWVELTLNTPFLHNSTQNLVIAVDENTSGYHSNSSEFYTTSVTGNRSIYYYNDDTNPNPSSPPTTGSYLAVTPYIPNTKLTLLPLAPVISVSPSSLAYGTVRVNTTTSNTFQISNPGNATLSGTITTPTGYSVVLGRGAVTPELGTKLGTKQENTRNTISYSVPASGSSTFTVSFNPTAVQAYNGNIVITHNAGGADATVALTGQGGKSTLGLSSTTFTASLAPGASSSQNLSVSNSGNMSLSYSLNIGGSAPWLTINGGTSVVNTIAVGGASQTITLAFNTAGLTPGTYNATINGTSNDSSNSSFTIAVTLTVTVPISITAPAGGEIWQSGMIQSIRWQYSGTAVVNALYYSTNGGGSWTSLGTVGVSQGSNSYSWTIPYLPSTNCKVRIQDGVAPNYSASSNVFTIITPSISIDPASLAFGTVLVNTTATSSFTITNSGTAMLSGSITTPAGYSVAETRERTGFTKELPASNTKELESRNAIGFSLPAGSSRTYTVTFSPTAVQAYNGNITIAHNAEGTSVVMGITGQGGKPVAAYSPGPFNEVLAIGSSSSQTLTIANQGNMPLSYSFSAAGTPAWLTFNGNTSVSGTIAVGGANVDIALGFNVTGLAAGNYHATINGTTNDPGQLTLTLSANLEVFDPNHAPVINIPDSFSFAKNGSLTQDFSSYVSDADADELWLTCVESAHIIVGITGMSVTFTPAPGWVGTESVQFTVHDGTTESSDQVNITVINATPVIDLPDSFSFAKNGSLTQDFSSYVSDADADELWLTCVESAHIIVGITGMSVTFTPAPGWAGTESVQFTVHDGIAEASDQVSITVSNTAPLINIPEYLGFNRNATLDVDFSGYVSDANGDPLSLGFSGNTGILVSVDGLNVSFSHAPGFLGSETITFSVFDGTAYSEDTVIVTVNNQGPTIELPVSFNASENTPLPCDFTPYVSDPNNDPLTLGYSGNAHVAVLIEGMTVTFSPEAGWFGTEDIVITVSDGDLQSQAIAHIVVSHVVLSLETPVLTISNASGNRLLQWNSISDADEYWIYRATDPEGSYSLINTTTNLQYLDEDTMDTAFYYVKAVYLGE